MSLLRAVLPAAAAALAVLFGSAAIAGSPYDRYAPATPPPPAPDEDPFHWEWDPLVLAPGDSGKLALRLVVPQGFHVYKDMIEVAVSDAAGLVVGSADYPPGVRKADPVDGTDQRELYDADAVVFLPVTAPEGLSGLREMRVSLRHQGCRDGLCYAPHEEIVQVPVRVALVAAAPPTVLQGIPASAPAH